MELIEAWLAGGTLEADAAEALAQDIAPLIPPTPERAMALNAAYRMIVRNQSFIAGRDATIQPMDATVWRALEEGQPTGIEHVEAPWYPRR